MTKQEMIELLKTDVAAWNRWREENPDAYIDLSGANLEWAFLRGASLEGAILSDANLRGAKLVDADLSDANLRGAKLVDADLSGASLEWAILRGANLSGAKLVDAKLEWAILRGADLSGADLIDADLRGADIDYSCWPLWCGGLGVKIDAIQARLLLAVIMSQSCDDPEFEAIKKIKEISDFANKSHRVLDGSIKEL